MSESRLKRREFLKTVGAGVLGSCHLAMPKVGAANGYPKFFGENGLGQATSTDVILQGSQLRLLLLRQTVKRLWRLQHHVGYGNFNLLSYDQALYYARNHSSVGAFRPAELDFLEEIFFADATRYGFYGDKVFTEMTATIRKRDAHKVPGSGHYLFKGKPLELYKQVKREVGDTLVLTSGIRSVVKQMYLFLAKAIQTNGNLSLASYSVAPPGYSYHGVGDFDIGRRGFGRKNFTEEFAKTDEFQRLIELGHLSIRYPEGNPYGVRYEPWHIWAA